MPDLHEHVWESPRIALSAYVLQKVYKFVKKKRGQLTIDFRVDKLSYLSRIACSYKGIGRPDSQLYNEAIDWVGVDDSGEGKGGWAATKRDRKMYRLP